MVSDEKSILGVGVVPKKAEFVRHELLKAKILYNGKKIIHEGNLIFFPITDGSEIENILSTVEYKLEKKQFPDVRPKSSLKSLVEKEFPLLFRDGLVFKYD
ncbi:MAG: hypothetical protein ACTSR2_03485, partial [Candidatus Hodarchaeales archaeon]